MQSAEEDAIWYEVLTLFLLILPVPTFIDCCLFLSLLLRDCSASTLSFIFFSPILSKYQLAKCCFWKTGESGTQEMQANQEDRCFKSSANTTFLLLRGHGPRPGVAASAPHTGPLGQHRHLSAKDPYLPAAPKWWQPRIGSQDRTVTSPHKQSHNLESAAGSIHPSTYPYLPSLTPPHKKTDS